jgi:2-dehydro-3-deoxyphosphooctonate aldolase (KDO 8-P synthase)
MDNSIKPLGNRLPSPLHEKRLALILGPCVIEDAEKTFKIAREIAKIADELDTPFIFKASYDKANRSSVNSFRGPGIKEGLAILQSVKNELDIPVISDVHSAEEAAEASKVLDVIQIPAFLARQTDLLVEAGRSGKLVNIKKAQFMSPYDMKSAVLKVKSTGNENIVITERGTMFGYNNLVVDFRGIKIMSEFAPVIFDATHSVQLPGAGGDKSLGEREFIPLLARAAIASGASGIFMEVHPAPDDAPCDGPNMFPLDKLKSFLKECIGLFDYTRNLKSWDL